MPVPPPMTDSTHIETRLLIVAEMLEKAVYEVRRAMADIKGGLGVDSPFPAPDVRSGASDVD